MKQIERKRSFLSTIAFFIGTAVAPEITSSSWFGKQKMSEKEINKQQEFLDSVKFASELFIRRYLGWNYIYRNT